MGILAKHNLKLEPHIGTAKTEVKNQGVKSDVLCRRMCEYLQRHVTSRERRRTLESKIKRSGGNIDHYIALISLYR